jgi:hypothetical protein
MLIVGTTLATAAPLAGTTCSGAMDCGGRLFNFRIDLAADKNSGTC